MVYHSPPPVPLEDKEAPDNAFGAAPSFQAPHGLECHRGKPKASLDARRMALRPKWRRSRIQATYFDHVPFLSLGSRKTQGTTT